MPDQSRIPTKIRALLFAAAVGAMAGMASPVLAAEDAETPEAPKTYPYLSGDISVEFYFDATIDADNPDAKGNDAYNTTEMTTEAHFSPRFSVLSHLVLEPVRDRLPGDDRYFEDHGLYVEELYGKLNFDPVQLFAGKFDAAFGRAWDDAPGIYGTDIAADYELTERIGAGFSFQRDDTVIGTAKLLASVFHADTSVLGRSAFTSRGEAYLVDGGLSDTGDFSSFAVSLEGEKLPGLSGISYNLGFVHQAGSVEDLDDQNGVVFGLQAERSYNGVAFKWIAETAYFDYGGDVYAAGDPALFADKLWYRTLGVEAKMGKYHAAAVYATRDADLFDGTHFDDVQYQLSAGIDLGENWTLDIGYKFLNAQAEESHTVGLMLVKAIEWTRALPDPR
jgi:hypothetical protein